jgi:hypothetical protein
MLQPSRHTLKCPVCKTILGSKSFYNKASFICIECNVKFDFPEGEGKPKATVLHLEDNKKCGCGLCGR